MVERFFLTLTSSLSLSLFFIHRLWPWPRAPRGAPWRKVVYGTVGDLSSKDQAAALRPLAAQRSYVDGGRVGVWGWSGGGSNTLNAMFRFPEIFRAGVSVAPVPDQLLYDAIYQERYSGVLPGYAEGYRQGSPITHAEGLRGDTGGRRRPARGRRIDTSVDNIS